MYSLLCCSSNMPMMLRLQAVSSPLELQTKTDHQLRSVIYLVFAPPSNGLLHRREYEDKSQTQSSNSTRHAACCLNQALRIHSRSHASSHAKTTVTRLRKCQINIWLAALMLRTVKTLVACSTRPFGIYRAQANSGHFN
jgi:hypothetical protein